jgi:hypothetical protein
MRLLQRYRNLGLHLRSIENTMEAGIMEISQRMQSGRLKVFPSLVKYLAERKLYRRDENDRVVREGDNLQDATRCLVLGIPAMATEPEDDEDERLEGLGRLSWFSGPGGWMR